MEKIEKLELKHLCGYLPHGLKCLTRLHKWNGQNWGALLIYGITSEHALFYPEHDEECAELFEDINPLLLPLSALTEPLEDGSVPAIKLAELLIEKGMKQDIASTIPFTAKIVNKPFGKLLKVTKCDEWYLMLSFENPERVQHIILEKLLEWHFDIYGLITAGLAIDKRTVKI